MLDSSMEFALTAGMLCMGLALSAAILGAICFVLVAAVEVIAAAIKALQNRKKRGSDDCGRDRR